MPGQDASDCARDRLAPEMLLYGFVRAVGRFTRSGLNEEALTEPNDAPDLNRQVLAAEWGTAVFEAINWSVALDERLRHQLDGSDWTADLKGGGVVRALRYARNCVHHNWAAALDENLGPNELVAPHVTVFGITWANELHSDRPDRRGAAAYGQALAGRNVGDTLLAAVKVYEEGVRSLVRVDESPKAGAVPKAMALYHCVYAEENFLLMHSMEKCSSYRRNPQREDLPDELHIWIDSCNSQRPSPGTALGLENHESEDRQDQRRG